MSGQAEICIDRRRGCVVATLDRPRALNALTRSMCEAIDGLLRDAARDATVSAVVIKGAGEKAFCAGGDIRFIYDLLVAGRLDEVIAFYAVEYPMNARLKAFPKPWLALLDGVVMGGGVGVSLHGSHRIVTERTVFAMPETGIGLFPDVGATYALSRLPGAVGMYLGLTGARLGPGDCLDVGVATHFVPCAALEAFEADLAEGAADDIGTIVARHAVLPPTGALGPFRNRIDSIFGRSSLEAIIHALRADGSAWAREQIETLGRKSPTSLAVTFRQLTAGRELGFPEAMQLEFRLVNRFMRHADFREGVRAVVVDKDQAPRWQPARLEEVSPEVIETFFAPLQDGDLPLDDQGGGR